MSHQSFDHTHTSRRLWWSVMIAGSLTLIFGTVGLWKFEHQEHELHPEAPHSSAFAMALTSVYHAAQMLILHTPHFDRPINGWMEAARWFGVFTFGATATVLLLGRLRHESRLIALSKWSGHVVVCGIGYKGIALIHQLRKSYPAAQIVAIDSNPDAQLAHECEHAGGYLIHGDATESAVLRQASAARASEVIAITPDDETNVRIAMQVRGQSQGGRPVCRVHLSDMYLPDVLQPQLERDLSNLGQVQLFDMFDHTARRILLELPIDGAGIRAQDQTRAHVVVLGFGRKGRSIALRAAKMGQFANCKPVRISVIDRNAEEQRQKFLFRYPILGDPNQKICDLKFHQMNAESMDIRKLTEQWCGEADAVLHLFVCLDNPGRSTEVAIRLREIISGRRNSRVVMWINSRASLISIFGTGAKIPDEKGTDFRVIDETYAVESLYQEYNEGMARTIHDAFVRDRMNQGNRRPGNDPALHDWDKLRDEFRESNRQQADHIPIKLRAIGCEAVASSDPRPAVTNFGGDIEMLARMEHARWNAERWLANWRYGEPPDKAQRISDCLVEWNKLTPEIQEYDIVAVKRIPALLGQVQMKVVKSAAAHATTVPA